MAHSARDSKSLANYYQKVGYWRGETIAATFHDAARCHSDRTAIVCGSRRRTYHELDERVRGLALGFAGLGLRRGDRVVVQLPNVLEFVEAFLALCHLGAVPVLMLPNHRWAEISDVCRRTEPVGYLVSTVDGGFDCVALAERARRETPSLRWIVVAEHGYRGEHPSLDDLGQSVEAAVTMMTDASETALILLTGGTTGTPKLVARTHDDYLCAVQGSAEVCRVEETDVYLAALPVTHGFTLGSPGVLGTLCAGATVVLTQSRAAADVLPLIAAERVTMTGLVPGLLASWLGAVENPDDLDSLRLIQIGGARPDPALVHQALRVFGCVVQQNYGMSEGLVCFTRLDDPIDVVLSTQGKPATAADELRVVDDHNQPVEPGQSGHLLVRGPCVVHGYYGADRPDPQWFTSDGFYRSGDIVRLTDSGYVVVVGRAKDQVNRGGEKIDPVEVETELKARPGVLDAAVVAAPDDLLGECACAYLVTDGRPIAVQELAASLRAGGLADYKIPDRFEFLDAMPTTGVGKLDKTALRRWAAASTLPQPVDDAARSVAGLDDLVLAGWSAVLGHSGLALDDDVFERGADSAAAIRAAQRISGDTRMSISAALVFAHPTARGLASAIRRPANPDEVGSSNQPDLGRLVTHAQLSAATVARWTRGPVPAISATPNRVLLTGATGYVGAHLLAALLTDSSAQVTCLVRATDAEAARQRLHVALAANRLPVGLSDRVTALPADLAQPRFGLDPARFATLAEEYQAIYHVAASVSLVRSYQGMQAVNLDATRQLLDIAMTGAPTPLHHISTLALAPPPHLADQIPEDFVEPHAGLTDGYRQTKWCSERLLQQAVRHGAPVAVYRLGRVMAPEATGAINRDDLIWRLCQAGIRLGALPGLTQYETWTPADWTADAVLRLSRSAPAPGTVFNLAPTAEVNLRDLVGWITEYGYALNQVTGAEWIALADKSGDPSIQETAALFDPAIPVHEALPDVGQGRVCAEQTMAVLRGGPVCPPADRSYLHHVFDRWAVDGSLPQRQTATVIGR